MQSYVVAESLQNIKTCAGQQLCMTIRETLHYCKPNREEGLGKLVRPLSMPVTVNNWLEGCQVFPPSSPLRDIS